MTVERDGQLKMLHEKLNFKLRQVKIGDAQSLQRGCWSSWDLEIVIETLRRVSITTAQGRGLAIVACVGDQILGYGQLTFWPRAAEISDLIVNPDFRRQGIGTAIIEHLSEFAWSRGVETVEIGAAAHNVRALALYRRLGFRATRELNLDLGNGPEPVIYLERRRPVTHPESKGCA